MKLLQKMKQKKTDNKGFSLVELIIVIAIMAILVGIVGTQVVPYLEKSKEAKDLQIISSYSTAAATAYASKVDKLTTTTGSISFEVYGSLTGDSKILADEIKNLTYASVPTDKLKSKVGKEINGINITYNLDTRKITVQGIKKGAEGATETNKLDAVESEL